MNQTEETVRCAVKNAFENQIIVTRYNNKIYKIKRIDFNKNPNTQFTITSSDKNTGRKKQTKQTYAAYVAEKYYKTVTNSDQPLLETENGLYLIPEFCFITGLPKGAMEQPSKFSLVREFVNCTNPDI